MRLILFILLLCASCVPDYSRLSAFAGQNIIHVVVEIPAGTSLKYEYDSKKDRFIVEQLSNGKSRTIKFLPYPGNYGFIPSTCMAKAQGWDGDALDVLVLSSSIKRGSVVRSMPIALLKMVDKGELDYKIIAVPESEKSRLIDCKTWDCLQQQYPAVVSIIETWFRNYKETPMEISGWGNEHEALAEILKWRIK